jgi:preprotein translocase subunit SecA
MGFWDWLSGKPKRVTPRDKIWLTRTAKRREVCRELQEHLAAAQPVLLLAHFPASLAEIRQELLGVGIPHHVTAGPIAARHVSQHANRGTECLIQLGLVKQLHSDPLSDKDVKEPGLIHLLITERHFLRKNDEVITDFAETLRCPSAVTFYLSLEDPLMKTFAGEWIKQVLQRMGMEESSAIESRLLTRRVRKAQDKIAKRAEEVGEADSAEEWLRLNVPGHSVSGA